MHIREQDGREEQLAGKESAHCSMTASGELDAEEVLERHVQERQALVKAPGRWVECVRP